MDNDPRANRQYSVSPLPTLTDESSSAAKPDVLFAVYREVCNGWRMLTDVRFKLLGFVPALSGVVLLNLLSTKPDSPSPLARIGVAIFGLLITLALLVYEQRNSELYDDLISRGRKIEEELGVDTGLFRGRRKPTRKLIRHDVAIHLIYGTTIVGWLSAILIISFGI